MTKTTEEYAELMNRIRELDAGAQKRIHLENKLATALRSDLKDIIGIYAASYRFTEEDVEDLTQTKTPKLMTYLLEAQNQANVRGILFTTAKRLCIDLYRKRKRMSTVSMDGEYSEVVPEIDKEAARQWKISDVNEDHSEKVGRLLEEVWNLPAADRELLVAVYVRHESIESLAEKELAENPKIIRGPNAGAFRTLDVARNAVDQRLTRARRRLAAIMNPKGERS